MALWPSKLRSVLEISYWSFGVLLSGNILLNIGIGSGSKGVHKIARNTLLKACSSTSQNVLYVHILSLDCWTLFKVEEYLLVFNLSSQYFKE